MQITVTILNDEEADPTKHELTVTKEGDRLYLVDTDNAPVAHVDYDTGMQVDLNEPFGRKFACVELPDGTELGAIDHNGDVADDEDMVDCHIYQNRNGAVIAQPGMSRVYVVTTPGPDHTLEEAVAACGTAYLAYSVRETAK